MGHIENRLAELGITLPRRNRKGKGILPLREENGIIYLSGHGCETETGEPLYRGRVGAELTIEQGYEAARQCGLNLLSSLQDYLGTLDRVEKIIRALGFVNSAPDFYQQPAVMHGFSDLMVEVFGERGMHARSAIGTSVLPANQAVEIELTVKVRP